MLNIKDVKFKSDLQRELRRGFNNEYYDHVYCEVNGKPMYLKEDEVRLLQNMCIEYCTEGTCNSKYFSEEKFNEWCKLVVVYNGKTKRHHHPLTWDKGKRLGWFTEKFPSGFFDVNSTLHTGLLRYEYYYNKK